MNEPVPSSPAGIGIETVEALEAIRGGVPPGDVTPRQRDLVNVTPYVLWVLPWRQDRRKDYTAFAVPTGVVSPMWNTEATLEQVPVPEIDIQNFFQSAWNKCKAILATQISLARRARDRNMLEQLQIAVGELDIALKQGAAGRADHAVTTLRNYQIPALYAVDPPDNPTDAGELARTALAVSRLQPEHGQVAWSAIVENIRDLMVAASLNAERFFHHVFKARSPGDLLVTRDRFPRVVERLMDIEQEPSRVEALAKVWEQIQVIIDNVHDGYHEIVGKRHQNPSYEKIFQDDASRIRPMRVSDLPPFYRDLVDEAYGNLERAGIHHIYPERQQKPTQPRRTDRLGLGSQRSSPRQ